MTFLPIVDRELRVAARLTATYRNRVILASAATLIGMFMFAFGAFSASPSGVGRAMFWTLSYLTLAFCLFEGVRKTADCLSEEKREGTLGLLFLTDLRGYDIIFGKLAAKSLGSFYGLLSVLPVLALSLLLGGVTAGEYWRMVLALTSILFFSLCSGLWISCWSRDERQAFTGTFLFIAGWIVIPLVTGVHALYPLSPLYAVVTAGDRDYALTGGGYWWSVLFTQGLNWTMLLWGSFLVPNCWREEKFRAPSTSWWGWGKARPKNAAKEAVRRGQMLDFNPAFWLADRRSGQRRILWVLVSVTAILSVVMMFSFNQFTVGGFLGICWILNFVVKMRFAAQACHCLAEARHNSALEMLLVTPLQIEAIIGGQILALQRVFVIPVITMLALQISGLGIGYLVSIHGHGDDGTEIVWMSIVVIGYLAFFALDMFAVAWTGMWYGLSSKSEGKAVTKTILLVLVLPLVCLAFFCYGFPFVIGIPLVCAMNGKSNLQREFRRLAGQRYIAPVDVGWIPGVTTPAVPVPQRIV